MGTELSTCTGKRMKRVRREWKRPPRHISLPLDRPKERKRVSGQKTAAVVYDTIDDDLLLHLRLPSPQPPPPQSPVWVMSYDRRPPMQVPERSEYDMDGDYSYTNHSVTDTCHTGELEPYDDLDNLVPEEFSEPDLYLGSIDSDSDFVDGTTTDSLHSSVSKDYRRATQKSVSTTLNLESMVHVYWQHIVELVKVTEIVPHLHFIDDTEPYTNKDWESPKTATAMLMDTIAKCSEPGKWTAFLDALKAAGYQYIADLLTGETDTDHSIQRKLIEIFKPQLIMDMHTEDLIDRLFEKGVISGLDKEEIEKEITRRGEIAGALVILNRIPRRKETWFHLFIQALRESGHAYLADQLTDGYYEPVDPTINDRVPTETKCKELYEMKETETTVGKDESEPRYGEFDRPTTPPPLPPRLRVKTSLASTLSEQTTPAPQIVTSTHKLQQQNEELQRDVDILENDNVELRRQLKIVKRKRQLNKENKSILKLIAAENIDEDDEDDDDDDNNDAGQNDISKENDFEHQKSLTSNEEKISKCVEETVAKQLQAPIQELVSLLNSSLNMNTRAAPPGIRLSFGKRAAPGQGLSSISGHNGQIYNPLSDTGYVSEVYEDVPRH